MLLKQSLVNNVGDFVWSAEQTFIYDSLVPWATARPPPRPPFLLLPASKIHIDTFLASSAVKTNPSKRFNPMATLE